MLPRRGRTENPGEEECVVVAAASVRAGGSRASDTGGQVVVVCGGGLADGRPAVVIQNSLYQQLLELVVGRATPA